MEFVSTQYLLGQINWSRVFCPDLKKFRAGIGMPGGGRNLRNHQRDTGNDCLPHESIIFSSQPKLYIPSRCYKNSNESCTYFWTVRSVLKIAGILLKYPKFEGAFSYFLWQNKYKIVCRILQAYRVQTKLLICIKWRKLFIFTLKCTFWG